MSNCKHIYLGNDWTLEDLNSFGLGSVYLAGPRNKTGYSWRLELIKKIEKDFGLSLSFLIPETKSQIFSNSDSTIPHISPYQVMNWQRSSIACATAIVFWFPLDCFDAQSFVEFGCWCKSERVFVGGDPCPTMGYIDWLINSEQKIRANNSLDELAENFVKWLVG